jgi:hypothetical protein
MVQVDMQAMVGLNGDKIGLRVAQQPHKWVETDSDYMGALSRSVSLQTMKPDGTHDSAAESSSHFEASC